MKVKLIAKQLRETAGHMELSSIAINDASPSNSVELLGASKLVREWADAIEAEAKEKR